jgi:hypothetical protein
MNQYVNDLCGGDIENEKERVRQEEERKSAKKIAKMLGKKEAKSNGSPSTMDKETKATSNFHDNSNVNDDGENVQEDDQLELLKHKF